MRGKGLHSPATGPDALGAFNETGSADPRLDARIRAAALLDGDERRLALQEIGRLVDRDVLRLPLFSDVDQYGVARPWQWRPRGDASGILLAEVRRAPAP